MDLKRAWWTSPLSPLGAWSLEKSQIENALELGALVSITDHDNIDAGLHLGVLDETRACFTENPEESGIAPLLERLHSLPETLIVFNHPLWDEKEIGQTEHRQHVDAFIRGFGRWLHALELNGLRPWQENQSVAQLAAAFSMPLISGGDRHGREPNACVNLTNASSFAEFADEVRRDGWSDVLFMPQYREPFKLRILQNVGDILENDEQHSLGWMRWCDRVFYVTDEGVEKSLAELWGNRFPTVVNRFVALMGLVRHRRVIAALRLALMEKREFALRPATQR